MFIMFNNNSYIKVLEEKDRYGLKERQQSKIRKDRNEIYQDIEMYNGRMFGGKKLK